MIINFAVGLIAGIISGFGIGGGSLLILYLTSVSNIDQFSAQGINLLYFLFCAPGALYYHIKNHLVDKRYALTMIISGVITAVIFSYIASFVDVSLLRRMFGILILYIGVKELFCKKK